MSETPEQSKNPKINISIDHSENEKQLQKQLDEAHIKIGALLAENKKEFVPSIEVKQPPLSSPQDTAQLEPKRQTSGSIELDVDCSIPLEAKGDSPQQIFEFLDTNARKGNRDAQKILGRMVKKTFSGDKAFDATFTGSNIDFNKTPKVIGEWDNSELKAHKTQFNERLRKNRTENWKVD
jgi:hypothetical protein